MCYVPEEVRNGHDTEGISNYSHTRFRYFRGDIFSPNRRCSRRRAIQPPTRCSPTTNPRSHAPLHSAERGLRRGSRFDLLTLQGNDDVEGNSPTPWSLDGRRRSSWLCTQGTTLESRLWSRPQKDASSCPISS